MAKTDAEKRSAEINDKSADRRLLGDQPGKFLFLPNVLGAAHDDHQIVGSNVRYGLPCIEFDRVPSQPIGFEKIAENTGMLNVHVLENENLHRNTAMLSLGTHARISKSPEALLP
jgi:hypothetical protein